MGRVRVDFTDQADFSPVPSGVYLVEVTKYVEEDSKKSGDPMLVWDLTIVNGEFAGKGLRTWTMLAGKGTFGFEQFWTAITGDAPPYVEEGGRKVLDFDPDDLLGKNLRVSVLEVDNNSDKAKEQRAMGKEVPKVNQIDDYLPA